MLPSQRARSRDRSRHGPRRTVILWECPRCQARYDGKPLAGEIRACQKCWSIGYMRPVRVRD